MVRNKEIMQKKSWISACVQGIQQQAFYATYNNSFTVERADSPEKIEQALRLRYDVYCRENAFLDPQAFPQQMEHDEFDARAVHHLLIHKDSGAVAGTIRVLLPNPEGPLTSFELQKNCDHPLLQIENRVMGLAEISRFCMARDFRRRPRDGHILPSYYEQEWAKGRAGGVPLFRRRIPYAPLGLLRAAFETIMAAGILDVVMAVDPGQFRSLKRLGLEYRVLGPRLPTLGTQQPFIFNIKAAFDSMAAENPECWDIISERGSLHRRANELSQNRWQDEVFDELCRELIMNKLI